MQAVAEVPQPCRCQVPGARFQGAGVLAHHDLLFDRPQVGDRDKDIQRTVPVDMQMKLDTAGAAFGIVRPDIGDVHISLAQVRAAGR